MVPNTPTLGIRFDIKKSKTGMYGIEYWEVFWRAVDVHKLTNTWLFEGDTAATLNGEENAFCIAVQSINPAILGELRAILEQSAEFQKVSASPEFLENAHVWREPLASAGEIDSTGNLVGRTRSSRTALDSVLQEKQQLAQQNPVKPVTMVKEQSTTQKPDINSSVAQSSSKKKWWQFWK